MKPHAFVAMPFGVKKDAAGIEIDFNRVYTELIKPAVEAAGLDVFRADEEMRAGDIRTDMFQELLMADLVVADLTIDNPNVWYELGVRHALRARGVVLLSGGRATTAFDVYTDRKIRYGLAAGGPDPATLEKDRGAVTRMVTETMESWHGRAVSPVYSLLPNLQEPDWKTLREGSVLEFWGWYEKWAERINAARRQSLVGDVLIFADEAPVAAFRADAWITAGEALRKAGRNDFALEQLRRGLDIEPTHKKGLQGVGICLQRLAMLGVDGYSVERARDHYKAVLKLYPDDAETRALAGRVEKDAWIQAWRLPGRTPAEMREDAAYEDALLRAAIDAYDEGYHRNPGHYYSGINALTLMHLYRHLTGKATYDAEMTMVEGAVRFAARCEPDEAQLFWSKSTIGDLEVLVGTPEAVTDAYKEAIVHNDRNWFALQSCRSQLLLLQDLGFRPDAVAAGLTAFDRALQRLVTPVAQWQPRQVLLFSGHMVDTPDREVPRFPAAKEGAAAAKIAAALDAIGAGADDLALTQGSCGGDLLFTEACQARGVKVHWLQPLPEPDFILASVVRGGESWRPRYYAAKAGLAAPVRSAPDALGEPPKNLPPSYTFVRCNLWLLYTALACGIDKVRFICLWDGAGGDGPGGTAHMYNEVKRRTGQVTWIDSRQL